jgi:hypothetical protein
MRGEEQIYSYVCGMSKLKAWLKQTCIKITNYFTHANALKMLGNIMYSIDCRNDQELNAWAKAELARVANEMPIVNSFWSYIKSDWLQKTQMWMVGNYN